MARVLTDLKIFLFESWLNTLLVFLPISIVLEVRQAPAVWVFLTAGLAIVPLAGLIGHGTEAAAAHTGPGLGGLLNATFGNATELIIALFAAKEGLYGVVKASISGSILGNMLLVLGLSMLAGGWGRERQTFNRTAAGSSTSMLMLAVTALVMPAAWDLLETRSVIPHPPQLLFLSQMTAGVLLLIYLASLVFALITHRDLLNPVERTDEGPPRFALSSAIALLLIATVLTAIESEILVHSIHPATQALGLSELFVGVIVVAVIGNAAEHFTAVLVARKGHMDLAFQIAIGSSTQIALLVAPILVFTSLLFKKPMDLLFHPFEIVALALAVLNVAMVSADGESNWFEGLQLIGVYLILGIAFFCVRG